jgi:hypothetical protein
MAVTKGLAPAAAPHASAQAVEAILATLARALPTAAAASSAALVREQQVLVRLARQFGLAEDTLRTRLKALRSKSTSSRVASNVNRNVEPAAEQPSFSAWERELVEIVLCHGDLMDSLLEELSVEELESAVVRQLYELAAEMFHDGEAPTFDRLMLAVDDPVVKNLLVDCDEQARRKADVDPRQRINDLLGDRRRRQEEARHRMMVAELQTNQLDPEQADRTLAALFDDLKRRQAGTAPTDG